MTYFESDYILRMLTQLRKLYEYLAGMTDSQLLEKGEDAIKEAMQQLTGLTPDVAMALDPRQIADMLGTEGEGLSRRFALAELLRARADLHERLGFAEDAALYRRRSLTFYLSAKDAPAELLAQAYPTMRQLFYQYFADLTSEEYLDAGHLFEAAGYFAPAEDAFCEADNPRDTLPAFYARLARLRDEELEAGGLSRQEVEDGAARVRVSEI